MGLIILLCRACNSQNVRQRESCKLFVDYTDNGHLGQATALSSPQSMHVDCPERGCPEEIAFEAGNKSSVSPSTATLMLKNNIFPGTILIFSLLLAIQGCTTINLKQTKHGYATQCLQNADTTTSYSYPEKDTSDNSDSLFIILTFSGGGTRAAAFSYGVLKQLHDTPITINGRTMRMLDEVDVISSVSGGSFTAAYYGLHKDFTFSNTPRSNGIPDFESAFLNKPVQTQLLKTIASPLNLMQIASQNYSRSDIAQALYDDEIFHGATFSDLQTNKKPFIMINATDLSHGGQFTFTQDYTDPLFIDLSRLKIATAVTASSAFPIGFSPVTLNRCHERCTVLRPDWVVRALTQADRTSPLYWKAKHWLNYREESCRYVHLIDGGIADNLGLRPLLLALEENTPPLHLKEKIKSGTIKRLAIIVVDAANEDSNNISGRKNSPGLNPVFNAVVNYPLDSVSLDSVNQLNTLINIEKLKQEYAKDYIFELMKSNIRVTLPKSQTTVEYYPTILSLKEDDVLHDELKKLNLKKIDTSLELPQHVVGLLIKSGARLLENSDNFKKLVEDLQKDAASAAETQQ